jgi:hypothetical protein
VIVIVIACDFENKYNAVNNMSDTNCLYVATFPATSTNLNELLARDISKKCFQKDCKVMSLNGDLVEDRRLFGVSSLGPSCT